MASSDLRPCSSSDGEFGSPRSTADHVGRRDKLLRIYYGLWCRIRIYYDVGSSEPAIGAVSRRENVAWRSTGASVEADNRQGCPIHLLCSTTTAVCANHDGSLPFPDAALCALIF